MSLNRILSQSAFWMVNKAIAKAIGVPAALMLSDLMDKKIYFEEKDQLDEDGYFFNTSVDIENNTTLTYHIQKECLKVMRKRGWVETKLKGLPAKLHFKVVENKILNFLITGSEETYKPDSEGFELNNNKLNNNKSNNIGSSGDSPELFPPDEIPKKKTRKQIKDEEPETLFKNSTANDMGLVKEKFSEEVSLGVDLEYYFASVKDWSATKRKIFRTEEGWIATLRNFMRSDNEKQKLKFVVGFEPVSQDISSEEEEFLRSRR